jgi:hypothetical protein
MPKGRLRTEPGEVRLVIHDPIRPPQLDAPTIHDAKILAGRAHDVVARTVASLQNGDNARQVPCT